MEGQTKDCHFVCLSPLSLIFPNTCLHLLCLVLFVLGYGWKRLDFDIFLEDRQSGLPPLQRFLHCSAEGSHPKRFSWTPCNHSTNLVVLFCFLIDSEHPTDYTSLLQSCSRTWLEVVKQQRDLCLILLNKNEVPKGIVPVVSQNAER